ncbi:hypothetical protein [Methylobacterium haplocladii]|uniref:Uncharacterized protein n=1 Tax=Methylobacterium haplocladii TaxID=1176176 RepID=A0A512IP78_9HYPH|nr:hypothetical protein [Methylobacterium haplocladii]GEO99516.1 hypothetical protein MHA02_19040 [Methylobacterium haplocladii]GJD83659.1 hypothetical protein HPGCJGGD_1529 [Methylobacterium haplocladii]GLS59745.1 hypothetical protein GCM10007887_24170 [Methylobacterium haplocladii]
MADIIPFRPRQPPPPAPDTRTRIEGALALALDAVDQLVAALDDIDGDPDREDGGDAEPSLAALENQGSQVFWMRGGDRDLEAE